MSSNIKYAAVYAPPTSSLNFMAHPSPTRGFAKGSYELYDPRSQGKDFDSVSKEMMNGAASAVAPGSPGSVHDYKLQVAGLQREVEERKRKEADLQQVINSLRATQSPSTSSFLDSQYMNPEGSPSSESVGENVKDAHIKHLQRQVTILQASLFKAEGWSQRVANANKEKDQACDELAKVKSELSRVKGENEELRQRNEELTQNLRLIEGQSQGQNVSQRSDLLEDLKKQRMEIKTLKESLTRLDRENRSLKDSSSQGSNQSLGNTACSQELEYLHKVVDTLKNTVLEQRSFLLNMRQPMSGSPVGQLSARSVSVSVSPLTTKDSTSQRNSSSPTLQSSEASAETQSQPVIFGRPAKSSLPSVNLLDSRQLPPRNGSAPELGLEKTAVLSQAGRRLSSREMLEESTIIRNASNTLPSEAGLEFQRARSTQEVGTSPKPTPHMMNRDGDGYITPVDYNVISPRLVRGQQASGDMMKPRSAPSGAVTPNEYINMHQPQPTQRKTSQSEVLRRNPADQPNMDQVRSKTETLGRNPDMFPQEGRNAQQWNLTPGGNAGNNVVTNLSPFGLSPISSQQQEFVPYNSALRVQAQPDTQAGMYEGLPMQNEFVWDEHAVRNMLDNNLAATMENLNMNLSASQPQIYHPPSNYHDSSVRVINHDMMGGGRMTVPTPSAHRTASQTGIAAGQTDLYVNAPARGSGGGDNSSSVDLDPPRPRLTSDRLCPVCNRDYSHVSMEDFQTHVFECFDDENAPETMKPQPSPERSCPMCNAKFGSHTPQAEYEKHVHGHFGEETFEVLNP